MINTRLNLIEKLEGLFPTGRGVEIGVFKGQFSKEILSKWGGTLYMVDVWRPLGDEYEDCANHSAHTDAYVETMDNIRGLEERGIMIRSNSREASSIFADESLDFIYIDANHAYEFVKEDINIVEESIDKRVYSKNKGLVYKILSEVKINNDIKNGFKIITKRIE